MFDETENDYLTQTLVFLGVDIQSILDILHLVHDFIARDHKVR